MATRHRASNLVEDYMNIRSIPAMLSVAFVAASLYQFGGITAIELSWLGNYALTGEHAAFVSLGAFLVAFMSSETSDFQYYEDWEKVAIALGPVLIVGQQYVTEVNDFIVGLGDPLGYQIAFLITVVSWGVTVQ